MTDPAESAACLETIRRAVAAVANDRPTPEQIAEWNEADKAMAQRIRAALPGVPLHHAYAVLRALRVMQRMDSAVAAPATDQAAPAVWIDDHPQLEAIAAAVWDRCRTEGTSLVVDDPRNIAVAAYTAAFEATVSNKAAPKADSKGATGQAALRDRIRRVLARIDGFDFDSLEPHDYQIQATAILAELPAPADRATVLREAADAVFALDFDELRATTQFDSHQQAWELGTIDAANKLRGMASAAATDDAPAATCSAQYHGPGDERARLCIRAAQHTGKAHTDEHGFHWSDTVAMYPLADGTFRTGVNLRAELRRLAAESAPADTGHDDSEHVYLSTGCQHEDLLLPDGRTGHQYCEDMTGLNGAKRPAECKHCGAPCQCPNHAAAKQQPKEA